MPLSTLLWDILSKVIGFVTIKKTAPDIPKLFSVSIKRYLISEISSQSQ